MVYGAGGSGLITPRVGTPTLSHMAAGPLGENGPGSLHDKPATSDILADTAL